MRKSIRGHLSFSNLAFLPCFLFSLAFFTAPAHVQASDDYGNSCAEASAQVVIL